MKSKAQSMDPDQAAAAFFGQDDASFAKTLAELTAHDPRLTEVFLQTRQRYLAAQNTK